MLARTIPRPRPAMETALQTLGGDFSAATVVVGAAANFIVVLPGANANGLTGVLGGADATLFGLDALAQLFPGTAALSISDALDRILALDSSWYWLTLDPEIEDDDANMYETARAVAAWVAPRRLSLLLGSRELQALVTDDSTSLMALLRGLSYSRVVPIWSRHNDFKPVSYAAFWSSIDFQGTQTQRSPKFVQLPGCAADSLTTAQEDELRRKRVNFYRNYSGTALVAEGTTFGPGMDWVDNRYFADWISNAIQTDIFNLLVNSNKIPNTVDGVASIKNVIAGVCEQGVQNGGIATATRVSEALAAEIRAVTGNYQFDGELSNGWLAYAGLISSLSQAQRDARQTVAFYVWFKLAGAVHSVNVALTFEN